MIDAELVIRISKMIPAGERSDFANRALERELQKIAREKAFAMIDALKKRENIRLSDEEIIQLKQYGRP